MTLTTRLSVFVLAMTVLVAVYRIGRPGHKGIWEIFPGAAVATVLSRYGIGIDAVLQRPGYPHSALPFIITLESARSAMLGCALQEINRLDFHVQPALCLPILLD